ncbi:Uma2 family endonuclease [Lewinella sp. 4G2]|uniref:Uma2 family endonuclease n=1 Tax=Lewinella sp. 4G2 TaxID=1803372 RepID=UPI0007B4B0C8|nr:Uma2 family endonuclease [Lewinella sp. 4G2]OAV42690.1 hypothetical protein A3850_015725 [Lewinella sp. 4G2]
MGIENLKNNTYGLLSVVGPVETLLPMSLEEFTQFCETYPHIIAERESSGKVIIATPVKSASGENEGHVSGYLYAWNLTNGKPGKVYSPSTGFLLAGEQIRCGDAVWVSNERLKDFLGKPDHQSKWVTAVPNFVAEIRSGSDRLVNLKDKMENVWMANGVSLAWLIDVIEEVVYIYRPNQAEPEVVRNFDGSILQGEDVLQGFQFPLVELNL